MSTTFDAGSIEASLTLDRTNFTAGLQDAKLAGEDFGRQSFTAKIGLDTAQAKLDLLAFKADLDTLQNVNLNIGISGSNAQIDAIRTSASTLDGTHINMSIQIDGLDKALTDLKALRSVANGLQGRSIRFRVNVDGIPQVRAQLTALQVQLDHLGTTNAQITTGTNTLTGALGELTPGIGDLVAVALLAAPAIVPIGAAMLSVAGATAAMGVAVGAGLGIFGAAVAGAVKNVTGLNKTLTAAKKALDTQRAALDQLKPGTKAYADQLEKVEQAQEKVNEANTAFSPAQRAFANGVQGMQAAWTNFIQATQGTTLPIVTTLVNALSTALPKAVPVVKAMAPEIKAIADDIARWVSNGGLDTFLNTIITTGVPAFRNLRLAADQVLTVLGNGYRAFLPQVNNVASAIKKGATSLGAWSNNGGFTNFLLYVKSNGPQIHKVLSDLGTVLKNVGTAMKNMGGVGLTTTGILLGMLAALSPGQIQDLVYAYVALRAAILLYSAGSAIATAVTWLQANSTIALNAGLTISRIGAFGMVAAQLAQAAASGIATAATFAWGIALAVATSPITLVILGIGLLVAAILYIALKTTWFQTAWRVSWAAIQTAFHAVLNFFTKGMGQFLLLLAGPIGALIYLGIHWKATWSAMQTTASAVWNFLRNGIINPIGTFFTRTIPGWGTTMYQKGFRDPWNSAYSAVRSAYNSINNNVFQPVGKFFTKTIPGWAGTMRDAVKTAFSNMRDGIGTIWKGIEKLTATPINFVINDVYNDGIRKVWNGIAKAVGLSKLDLPSMGGIKYAEGGAITGANTGLDTKHIIARPGEHIWTADEVKNAGGHNRVAQMRASYSRSGTAQVSPTDGKYIFGGGIIGDITGAAGKAVSGVKGLGSDVAGAVKGLVRGALASALDPVLNKISSTAKSGINAAIPGDPAYQSLVGGTVTAPIGWIKDFIKADDKKSGGSIGGKIPSGARKSIIDSALAAAHIPPPGTLGQWEAGLNTLITRESGWNASAVNRTDSNAKAGHPSQGLAQTIPGTFNHYVPASLKAMGILNPIANVAAAARYIVSRYGNISNVQQANANKPPKGYFAGGRIPAGMGIAGEKGPELVASSGGTRAFSAPETKKLLAQSAGGGTISVDLPDQVTLNVDGQQMTAFVEVKSRKVVQTVVSEAKVSK